MSYPSYVGLFVDGESAPAEDGGVLDVFCPADGRKLGQVARATTNDLDRALESAWRGYLEWKDTPAMQRYRVLRRAASLLRERSDMVSVLLSTEQGKPLAEAQAEVETAAELIDWFGEEARRAYGRIVPARTKGAQQLVRREPVGPVAAFTPWNFPISQPIRKIAPAIAAGCSIIVKPSEETPASSACLGQIFTDAGLPNGVFNIVYGDPEHISTYLIQHPVIRKVSFTGSVSVGKKLAELAGKSMKRTTMELGGHAPVLILEDANLDNAVDLLIAAKFRNAGQVCVSPTRFLIHESVYGSVLDKFTRRAQALKVGDGLQNSAQMGALINERRLAAIESMISDAVTKGANVRTGGHRLRGNQGSWFEPTVLTELNETMNIMNDEPFGPVALFMPFKSLGDAITEANRLPFGLAAYAFTNSHSAIDTLSSAIEAGTITINHLGIGLPEVPSGGIKDSGYGSEGGVEGLDAYLATKLVTLRGI